MNRVLDITKKSVWGLTALSITSCLIRNDYNVIFSFLVLIILNNFYNQNSKLFTKIIVQIFAVLVLADIIWLCVMMPTWKHLSTDKNEYWNSLSGMHTFGVTLAFLELFLKVLIALYLAYDFKQKNPEEFNDLWKFSYLQNVGTQKKAGALPNNEQKVPDAGVEIGGASDFVNPY